MQVLASSERSMWCNSSTLSSLFTDCPFNIRGLRKRRYFGSHARSARNVEDRVQPPEVLQGCLEWHPCRTWVSTALLR